jgi:hypothetical protein
MLDDYARKVAIIKKDTLLFKMIENKLLVPNYSKLVNNLLLQYFKIEDIDLNIQTASKEQKFKAIEILYSLQDEIIKSMELYK